MKKAMIDTETTGLDPDRCEVWELAVIERIAGVGDSRLLLQFRPNLDTAEPEALRINRFHERFVVPDGFDAAVIRVDGSVTGIDRAEMIEYLIRSVFKDVILVGSNTAFDATFTRKLLGGESPWHYRVINALELAVGFLVARGVKIELPWNSYDVSRRLGVEPPDKAKAHSAMPDAEWARDVFDKVNELGNLGQ